MTHYDLQTMGKDVIGILEALNAGDTGGAYRQTEALAHYMLMLQQSMSADVSSFGMNRKLAVLTGWSIYPPRYWQEMGLTRAQAGEALDALGLDGVATINGKTYYRLQSEAKARNYQKRKRLAA